jgi:hypothetical protein
MILCVVSICQKDAYSTTGFAIGIRKNEGSIETEKKLEAQHVRL